MARNQAAARLHLLSTREVLAAGDGDATDGGGLLLRVRDASASWVFRFTAATGRRREMGLGAAHRGSVKQAGDSLTTARAQAHTARGLIRQGGDPIDERAGRRQAAQAADQATKQERKRDQTTLARVARAYHERVIEPKLSAKHGANWIASLEHHIPSSIWHSPIASITAPALLAALSTVRSVEPGGARIPETLDRVRQRLDVVFDDAIFHGLCASNPAAAVRRKMRETLPANKAGQLRALPYREAPEFMRRLREAEGVAARCLEFSVLAACRTNESLMVTWAELDIDTALWTIPAERMKAKEEHAVPLSPRVLEILQGQRRLGSDYCFPSPMLAGRPMSNMAMLSVLDRLEVRDRTTVHGLCRATFSTWANETGAGRPDVIEACLAHQETNKVRAAYNRAQFNDERRALLEAWAAYLATPAASNVVAFERAA